MQHGCGPDFRGKNMMGKILMDVRKYDNQYELEYIYLTLQATNVKKYQNHEKLLHNKNPTH